ncbi:unnamed protein product (macronuclear) [Paramecium tetraurelia]|uniref:Uncharacterized protein n=1 Tax=Paramecium tetraurelia TaxID=5888 RepID=A0DJ24_PARTE|nr:uncharacterized protein GSPATT00017398001 [Paramecium tetraurelia]CAK83041.1 unnamed protein product [Paramecium tetraurelia]|eukprot:XP_001450438.1 hypothetical protein (macronuclear) [Paramecium tetraurelia strain d4-2]
MDQHHSKSFGALNQLNCQLFKPKPLPFRLQIGSIPTETPRVLKQALVTPSTNDNDSKYLFSQLSHSPSPQLRAFKSYRVSTEMLNGSPIDQIQLIIRENENLKKSLNQKQKIIDTLTRSQKSKTRFDFNDLKKNSRSHIQPQSQQEAIKPKLVEVKQSVSQNYNKRTKLPKIEDSIQKEDDDCNFTFAKNFFNNNVTCQNHKINFKQVFAQSHLKKKFFT